MGIPWDGTGINCYVMGQTNMSHGQSYKTLYPFHTIKKISHVMARVIKEMSRFNATVTEYAFRWRQYPLQVGYITLIYKISLLL